MRFFTLLCALAFVLSVAVVEPPAQDVERTVRLHDCRFIVSRGLDFPGPDLTRFLGNVADEEETEEAEFMPVIDGDLLVEMVKRNVRPDSWHHERNKILLADGNLTVVQTPDAQAEVARFLDVLRRARMSRIVITAHALTVRKDHFGSYLLRAVAQPNGTVLDPEQLAQFFGSEVMRDAVREVSTVTLDALPGQLVHAGPFRRARYVRDIDVEVAEDVAASVPVVDTLDTGTVFEVRPFIAGDSSVLLHLSLASAAVLGKPEEVDTGVGKIQLVQRSLQSLGATVLVPDGHGVLLAASRPGADGRVLVFILRPRVVGRSAVVAEPKKAAGDGSRELRVYNARLLTSRIPDRPAPFDEDGADGGAGWVTFEVDEEVNQGLESDALIQMIKSGIAEDTWSNTRNSIRLVDGLLVVVQRPEVLDRVGKYLDRLSSRRAVLVNTVVRVLAVDAERLDGFVPAEARQGRPLTAPELDALEKAAHQGNAVRRLEAAVALGFNRQLVHVHAVHERTVIRQLAVEVASKSSIMDPVVGALRTGLTLSVRPSTVGDGRHLRLDLDCRYTTASEPELLPFKTGEPEAVHRFETQTAGVLTSAYLADGATLAYLRGAAPGLKTHRLVFLVSVRAVRMKG